MSKRVQALPGSFVLPKATFVYRELPNQARILAAVQPFSELPLVGNSLHAKVPVSRVAAAIRDVFHLRHQQLLRLQNLGYAEKTRRYCHPGMVEYPGLKLGSCKHRLMCPFCWSRLLTDPLCKQVLTALYFRDGAWQTRPQNWGLLLRTRSWEIPWPEDDRAVKPLILQVLGNRRRDRPHNKPTLDELGRILLTTFSPTLEGNLRIESRRLTVYDEELRQFTGRTFPPPSGQGEILSYYKPPVRKNRLADLVGRLTAFPTGLLLGEASWVKKILLARDQAPFLSSSGVLRNANQARVAWLAARTEPLSQKELQDAGHDAGSDDDDRGETAADARSLPARARVVLPDRLGSGERQGDQESAGSCAASAHRAGAAGFAAGGHPGDSQPGREDPGGDLQPPGGGRFRPQRVRIAGDGGGAEG